MKKVFLAIVIIIILFVGSKFFSQHLSYCDPQDLQALLILSPGAGNVFATLTLKNISDKPCQITADNYIKAEYNKKQFKNITISHIDEPEGQRFHLAPNQQVYSQVHYPNGPQCSTGIEMAPVVFSYMISPSGKAIFVDQGGKKEQEVTVCKAITDITTIEIWKLSADPISE